jgi:hypothetical protein
MFGYFCCQLAGAANHSIYIRAYLEETHIVFSAEVAAIALATPLLNKMNLQQISFLSGCAR